MHQTFYIDVDEEISSAIDRLRKSMAEDNYFVVPKRAIVLQSVVNLKLLKREADKLKKRAIIVTQDEIGAAMAGRSGIEARTSLDGLESTSEEQSSSVGGYEDLSAQLEADEEENMVRSKKDKRLRLSSVGSSDFYGEQPPEKTEDDFAPAKNKVKRIHVKADNSHAAIAKSRAAAQMQTPRVNGISAPKEQGRRPADVYGARMESVTPATVAHGRGPVGGAYKKRLDPSKEKVIEKMFLRPEHIESPKVVETEKKTKKIFAGFIVVCLLVLAGVGAYLYVPSAKITITPNTQKKNVDVSIQGSTNPQEGSQEILVRALNVSENVSLTYDATGKSAGSGSKAHGSVVIYNEYSSEPQTLVATTRIESTDGKVFRISKNVVVPGSTTVGGESKPGAITVDVVADEPGSDYNIGPSDFTIPGFKGGPKFDKFHAKSTTSMTGGTSDGSNSGPAAISQKDIDDAKQKAEEALKQKVNDAISAQLNGDEKVLPQAEKVTITGSRPNVKVSDVAETFNYVAQASAQILVFSEKSVNDIVKQTVEGSEIPQGMSAEISKIDYGVVEPNFDDGTLDIKVHAEVALTPQIDLGQLKGEFLGKDESQLEAILKKNPSIRNIKVEFYPTFVSRTPQYSQRLEVVVGSAENQ